MQPSPRTLVFTIVFNQLYLVPDDELQLIEACKRGERLAQHRLYDKYARAMYNTCLRMLKVEADAEDALQVAFIEVFTKLHTFRGDAAIGAWIKRIVVNTCINQIKKRRLVTIDWDESIPDVTENNEDPVEQAFQVDRIRHAVSELPDGYRLVFSLYLLEGYDHAEIGEILNISETTSKSQYSRARRKVRKLLKVG